MAKKESIINIQARNLENAISRIPKKFKILRQEVIKKAIVYPEKGKIKKGLYRFWVEPKIEKGMIEITPKYDNISKFGINMKIPNIQDTSDTEIRVYRKIFDKYKNKDNWKMPLRSAFVKTFQEAQLVAAAFKWFAGGAEIYEQDQGYKVTSRGYYYYIGG
jgi:hypothetical protein